MGGGSGKRTRLNDGGAGEVIVEDGLSIGLENGFGRHCAYMCVSVSAVASSFLFPCLCSLVPFPSQTMKPKKSVLHYSLVWESKKTNNYSMGKCLHAD